MVKKNRNKRLSVGLRKIYSVYKIGDSFIAFLFFLLLMAAISDFFRDCDIMADTSDNFDTFLGPFKMHCLL